MRVCTRCKIEKPTSEFGRAKNGRDGLHWWCRGCRREYDRDRREQSGRGEQDKHLLTRYGLTVAAWDVMVEAQDGGCAVCGRPSQGRRLHVDHNHKTDQVRALLCGECNRGLGAFGDNPERLRAAADYLEHHAANPSGVLVRNPPCGRTAAKNGRQ